MQLVILIVGLAAIVGGLLVVRNYVRVFEFFRDRRRAVMGTRFESRRFSTPEVMRAVGIVYIAFGVLFVVVAIFYRGQ